MVYEPNSSVTLGGFNPYPLLGAPSLPCWPRGMPLHMVLEESSLGSSKDFHAFQNESSGNKLEVNFAVLQSLADIQPDVDAIYRLIRGTPFSFLRPASIDAPIVQKGKLWMLLFCLIKRFNISFVYYNLIVNFRFHLF